MRNGLVQVGAAALQVAMIAAASAGVVTRVSPPAHVSSAAAEFPELLQLLRHDCQIASPDAIRRDRCLLGVQAALANLVKAAPPAAPVADAARPARSGTVLLGVPEQAVVMDNTPERRSVVFLDRDEMSALAVSAPVTPSPRRVSVAAGAGADERVSVAAGAGADALVSAAGPSAARREGPGSGSSLSAMIPWRARGSSSAHAGDAGWPASPLGPLRLPAGRGSAPLAGPEPGTGPEPAPVRAAARSPGPDRPRPDAASPASDPAVPTDPMDMTEALADGRLAATSEDVSALVTAEHHLGAALLCNGARCGPPDLRQLSLAAPPPSRLAARVSAPTNLSLFLVGLAGILVLGACTEGGRRR